MSRGYPLQCERDRHPDRLRTLFDRRTRPHRPTCRPRSARCRGREDVSRLRTHRDQPEAPGSRPGRSPQFAAVARSSSRSSIASPAPCQTLERSATNSPNEASLSRSAGRSTPKRPDGQEALQILATFAEFEVDLLRMRTREGMAIARAKGKLKGRQPKLSKKQQADWSGCTTPANSPSPTSLRSSPSPGPPFTARSSEPARSDRGRFGPW